MTSDPVANDVGPDVQLVLMTDLQGTLEPCGCAAGMLGGIDRAAHVVAARRAIGPTLFVAAGDLLHGPTDGHDASDGEAMRTETLVGILDAMDLVTFAPGPHDQPTLARDLREAEFRPLLVGSEPGSGPGTLVRELGGHRIGLIGVSELPGIDGDLRDLATAAVAQVRADGAEFVLVLFSGNRRSARRISRIEGVDALVLGGQDRSEVLAPESDGTIVVHAGRQGEGLVTLSLFFPESDVAAGEWEDHSEWTLRLRRETKQAEIDDLAARLEAWEAEVGRDPATLTPFRERLANLRTELAAIPGEPATIGPGDRAFSLSYTPLPREAEQDPATRRLLAAYDLRLNEHNREAFADTSPPPAEEGQASYLGSASCQTCHQQAYAWWSGHRHGNAYETLSSRNKNFHLECVGCHVTGYQLPGGSTVTHLREGALENVGCENCHGPGSRHVADPSVDLVAEPPERTCVGCHNEEHSPRFVYEAYRRTLLVPGHGLPAEGDPAAPAGMDLTTMEAQP